MTISTRRKLQWAGTAGLDVTVVLTDRVNDEVWNGEELVEYDDADFDDYKIEVTELGHGKYTVDIPEGLPVGYYHAAFYDEDDDTDSIFQISFEWDGAQLTDDLVIGASVADICNLALSHLGSGETISNLDTDDSEVAVTLRLFYPLIRDATLRDFPWPFATRIVALPLVEEDPSDGYGYSYRYPSNALMIRAIGDVRLETVATRPPYKIYSDDSGLLLYTDEPDAEIEYTVRMTNPLKYPPDYTLALSYRLAHAIAPKVSGGDAFKLGDRALQMYALEIRKAANTAFNERGRDIQPDSDMVSGRG